MSGDGSMTDRDVCQNYLDSQAAFFASLQKQIDTVRTTCDQQLNILREGFESKFAALEGKVTGLQSDVAALQNELARQEPVDQHITATQARLTTEVDKLKDASKKQKSSIEKLATQNEQLITAFGSLETAVLQQQPAVDFMNKMQAVAGSRDRRIDNAMQQSPPPPNPPPPNPPPPNQGPKNALFQTLSSAIGQSDCLTAPEYQRSSTFARSGFASDEIFRTDEAEDDMPETYDDNQAHQNGVSAPHDYDSLYSLTSEARKHSSAQRNLDSDHDESSDNDVPAKAKPSKVKRDHVEPTAKRKRHSPTPGPTLFGAAEPIARRPAAVETQNDEGDDDTIEVAAKRPRASTAAALETAQPRNVSRISASPSDVDSPIQDSGLLLQSFHPRHEKAIRLTQSVAAPNRPTSTEPTVVASVQSQAKATSLAPPGTQPTPPTAHQAPPSSAPPTLPTTNGSVRRSGRATKRREDLDLDPSKMTLAQFTKLYGGVTKG